MSYQVILESVAEQDITEAAEWYETQSKDLGKRFVAEIRAVFTQLRMNPQLFTKRYRDIHTATVKVFPYLVHYLIEERMVIIIAVLHTSRSPKRWYSRD
ncbi:MAG: type II toxin-antitoxin system RelE/ParE family toxin [Flavobacteriales bacterium]|nr:type II toxin-antitoxin system RelE/ParE family toxin [Flavobacteriales bacterium]